MYLKSLWWRCHCLVLFHLRPARTDKYFALRTARHWSRCRRALVGRRPRRPCRRPAPAAGSFRPRPWSAATWPTCPCRTTPASRCTMWSFFRTPNSSLPPSIRHSLISSRLPRTHTTYINYQQSPFNLELITHVVVNQAGLLGRRFYCAECHSQSATCFGGGRVRQLHVNFITKESKKFLIFTYFFFAEKICSAAEGYNGPLALRH